MSEPLNRQVHQTARMDKKLQGWLRLKARREHLFFQFVLDFYKSCGRMYESKMTLVPPIGTRSKFFPKRFSLDSEPF